MSDAPVDATPPVHLDIACPFCGLLCDDLSLSPAATGLSITRNGCARARQRFALSPHAATTSLIDGQPAPIDTAIEKAAALLRHARQPLFLSGGADLASMRALLYLAEQCNAIVDHSNEGVMRNLRVVQDHGWITTTLTEVRNRADFILCVGTEISGQYPRFFERVARAGGHFDDTRPAPKLLFLGAATAADLNARQIQVPPENLLESIAILRGLAAGKQPRQTPAELVELNTLIRQARYAVVAWSAAALPPDSAELIIQGLCDWIKTLNHQTRVAGLPLGGSNGDLTALQTTLWQTGLPLRTRLGRRGPEHDSERYAARRLLDEGRADAMLFVSEFDASAQPPLTTIPTIVLGATGLTAPPCKVFIPVGTPGIHRTGHLFRTDSVVAVPLQAVTPNRWSSTPDVLQRMGQQLTVAHP